MHEKCSCQHQTSNCPRYGWMKGRKWEVCQGKDVDKDTRESLLSAYVNANSKRDSDPGFLEKVVNYATSTAIHAMNGFKETEPALKRIRLQVCDSCDQLTPERSCRACGCPVEEKANRASERCPLLKWPGDATAGACGCGK